MLKILFKISLLIITVSCCKNKNTIENILTNGSRGKLWDIVYQSDIHGNLQKSYFTPINSKDSIPGSSLFFGDNGVLKRYSHFTSDSLYLTPESDVIYKKTYEILENKIVIGVHPYLVKSMSKDSIILQRDSLNSKIFFILKSPYSPSVQ